MTEVDNHQNKTPDEAPRTPSSVRRPDHRMHHTNPMYRRGRFFKLRNTLNLLFMVLAVAGFAAYMLTEAKTAGMVLMLVGVVLKMVEVGIRMFHK